MDFPEFSGYFSWYIELLVRWLCKILFFPKKMAPFIYYKRLVKFFYRVKLSLETDGNIHKLSPPMSNLCKAKMEISR